MPTALHSAHSQHTLVLRQLLPRSLISMLRTVTASGGSGHDIRTRTVRTTVESELGFLKKHDILSLCHEVRPLHRLQPSAFLTASDAATGRERPLKKILRIDLFEHFFYTLVQN